MRRPIVLAVVLLMLVPARPAQAWGFEAHKYIASRAMALLPPEIRPFFEKFRDADPLNKVEARPIRELISLASIVV